MNTKEKIIQQSIRLFNRDGFKNVSLRNMAHHLKISDGNLRYYFRTKEKLLETLFEIFYKNLRTDLSKNTSNDTFERFETSLEIIYQHKLKFSFIFGETHLIIAQYKGFKNKYNEYYSIVNAQIKHFIEGVIEEEYMTQELEKLKEVLTEHIFFMTESWIKYTLDFSKGKSNETTKYFSELTLNLILPYLNQNGKVTYWNYKNKKNDT